MYSLRTRFKNQIVAEFLPPTRKLKTQRVVIVLSGAPSIPNKKPVLEFLSKKGFWVFFPRYRGTWESGGKFLARSPHQDVLDVIDGLHTGFTDLWSKNRYKLKPDQITLLASSFGGPAAIIASKSDQIDKAFVFCPVIDWTKPGKDESVKTLSQFTEEAFGQGYRTTKHGWKKLASGKFYNPINHADELDGSKLFLVHARDDRITPYKNTKAFAKQTGSKLITLPRGGHRGTSLILTPRFYNYFKKFTHL